MFIIYVKSTGMEGGYIQVVEDCARETMAKTAEEVKALPHFAQDGEV